MTAILTLGTALRLWSPAMRSDFWYDEVYSLMVAQRPFGEMLYTLSLGGDTNPPLYTVLLHFWLKLGSSDTHIKLLSVTFGVASIWAIYLLARQVGGRRVGLLSGLLLAVSRSAISYSIQARPYAIFLFLSTLSTYFFILNVQRIQLEQRPASSSAISWAGYSITTSLTIYCHWFGLLLLMVQTAGLVIYCPSSRQVICRHILSLVVVVCCCLPLVPFLWNQVRLQNAVGGFQWPGKPSWHSLVNVTSFLAGGRNLLLLIIIIFVVAYLSRKRQPLYGSEDRIRHILFFGGYVALPLIVVCAVSCLLARYSFFVPRYFLAFIIGVQILVSLALSRINRKVAYAFILLFVLAPTIKVAKQWDVAETPYSRLASELPKDCPEDVLIAHLSPISYYPALRYRQGCVITEKVVWSEAVGRGYLLSYNLGGEMLSSDKLVQFNNALSKYREVWVVIDPLDQDPKVQALLEELQNDRGLSLESEKRIGECRLQHYRRVGDPAIQPNLWDRSGNLSQRHISIHRGRQSDCVNEFWSIPPIGTLPPKMRAN